MDSRKKENLRILLRGAIILPERWIEAFLNPECFYCGTELPFDEVTKNELPQERICQRCHDKESDEIY